MAEPILVPTNFWRDYLGVLRRLLKRNGFRNYEHSKVHEFDVRYHDAMLRLVEPRPRTIQEASAFGLPPSATKHQTGLDGLKEKIRQGTLLTPHLSKDVFDLEKSDGLLLAWRIHHLHIGEKIDPNTGRIERTGPVLLARFEADDAYLIGVEAHGAWAREDVIETVISEWPHLVHELTGLKGAPPGSPRVTEGERKAARKAGVLEIYQSRNGKLYMPGPGYSTARTSSAATNRADRMRERIQFHEQRVAREFPGWSRAMKDQGQPLPGRVQLCMDVDEAGRLCAVVSGTTIRWPFPRSDD